ncbi:MAG: sugar ABC transporter permease [Chloroflexi bacterium]|nr:sugar ABC transporter permease [Chloroflexota bacterium]
MSTLSATQQVRPVVVRRRRRRWREYLDGYLFISPWVIGFFVFTAGPFLASVVFSLLDWDVIRTPTFVGLGNFKLLIGDELFWLSLYNTAFYTFLGVPLHVALALLVAMALNTRTPGINVFRTIYYLPSITPAVASALLWMWIFNPEFGLANAFLDSIGMPPQRWLWDPDLAKPTFILMSLWGIGSQMIIFLAGLQSVPDSLLEAAEIDGANRWDKFWNVTVPMVSPVIFFNVIMGIIGSFQVFTTAFITVGAGPGNTTLFYVLYLYRNGFETFRMGYASALAWVLFAIILGFTLLQFALADRWVYYEGQTRR